MENNHINNHICNNHTRNERNHCGRLNHEMSYCDMCDRKCENEHGGEVYSLNVENVASKNQNFRESIWTGHYLQMTVMCIPHSKNIGIELHDDTDQYIRVEHGYALVLTGNDPKCLYNKKKLCRGDAIFIPAGVWHDVVNVGRGPLKLSSVYAPPHHPKCTVEKHRMDFH